MKKIDLVAPILVLIATAQPLAFGADPAPATIVAGDAAFDVPRAWTTGSSLAASTQELLPAGELETGTRLSIHVLKRKEKEAMSFSRIRKDIRSSMGGEDFQWTRFSFKGSGSIKGADEFRGHYLEGIYHGSSGQQKQYYFFALLQGDGEDYLILFRAPDGEAKKYRADVLGVARSAVKASRAPAANAN